MACFSTSLGVLKAFIQPCHSHKKGVFGFVLGTLVTVNELFELEPLFELESGFELVAAAGGGGGEIALPFRLEPPLSKGLVEAEVTTGSMVPTTT